MAREVEDEEDSEEIEKPKPKAFSSAGKFGGGSLEGAELPTAAIEKAAKEIFER